MSDLALDAAGLPPSLALRVSGHVGPTFRLRDPVLDKQSFTGTHVTRTARIEPVTPPGAVYVTEAFAAALEASNCDDLGCDYVGHLPTAKKYGRLRMYRIWSRRTQGNSRRQFGA
jgi:class 3 adenylate cyclase